MQENFWETSDGETTAKSTGSHDSGGGDIKPIPKGTQVLAAIDEISWDELGEYSDAPGEDYIKARWTVLQPAEYKNRKVFHKIRPLCEEPKKADKAKKMFAAIDANAGGKLAKLGKLPDDVALQGLTGKPQVLMLQVWEIKEQGVVTNDGNWVSSVSPRKSQQQAPAEEPAAEVEQPHAEEAEANNDNYGDDIPF